MTITLTNKTNRMKVIPLPHSTYCTALGKCVCMTLVGMNTKVAASLTIPAGESAKDLPAAVLQIPQIVRMVRRGEIVAKQIPEKPVAKLPPKKSQKRKRKRRRLSASAKATADLSSSKTKRSDVESKERGAS